MDKIINNVVLHKELNELKILNKFYIENGEVTITNEEDLISIFKGVGV